MFSKIVYLPYLGKDSRSLSQLPNLTEVLPFAISAPHPLRGGAPGKGGGVESEFDFPPVLYVDLTLNGMTYPLALQVVQR